MSSSPIVTVLMPVYNGERYLHEAIESILNQTFIDFEFLIINDGSTDSSRSIICTYGDPRIRLIDNPSNLGLAKSLNVGLKMAKGKYVARQDADDISEPNRLIKQVNYMEANPKIALLGSWYREINAEGGFVDNVRLPSDQIELQWALLFYCPFVHSGVMLRKDDIVRMTGLYNEKVSYGEDHELWLRVSRRQPVTNFPDYLVRYRLNLYSMTSTYGERINEGIWLTISAIASLLGWLEHDKETNEALFKRMFGLLYGRQIDLNPREIKETTDAIWQLHRAFSQTYQLDQSDSERHLAKLRSWLGKRYIRVALNYTTHGLYRDARWLYKQGLHLDVRNFFTTKSIRFLYTLLLIQPVKTLGSYLHGK